MTEKVHHLPAIVLFRDDEKHHTLVTACGKRGALAVRDAAEEAQLQFLGTVHLCPDCLVKWDAAEEEGALRVVWSVNGKRQWAGPGAVVFALMVRDLLHEKKCATCGGRMWRGTIHPDAMAVIVREDRRPKGV